MGATKIEFAVQMTCESCVEAIKDSLKDVPGIVNVDVNLETKSVVVDTTLSTEDVHRTLLSTGRKAVVKGFAGSLAGVAVIETGEENVRGVTRFVQVSPNTCIVDGTIDGLKPQQYDLSIHECGDISRGCESVGEYFNPINHQGSSSGRIYGKLATINADSNGRATFRLEDRVIHLQEVIGRSLVISANTGQTENKVACGIIARSAGLFQNPKMICACDGVSIWDEKTKPKPSSL